MHLVYNGIDLNMQFGDGNAIRSAFPADAKIIGTIGELNNNKNQLELIERAKNDSAMHVAIVGEGELRPMLEQKISEYGLAERVKLFGFIPAQDVLKGFDVFALPSKKEGLPYALIEAKLAGLPIEANPVGGISEILMEPIETFSLESMVNVTAALY
jgi:glycosyltransferase involved in cell wall biosynthesis